MFGKATIVWHARTVPERRGAISVLLHSTTWVGGRSKEARGGKTWQPRLIACQCITASGASRFQGLFFFSFRLMFLSSGVSIPIILDSLEKKKWSLDIGAVSPPRTAWGEHLLVHFPFPISLPHSPRPPPPPNPKRQGRRKKCS